MKAQVGGETIGYQLSCVGVLVWCIPKYIRIDGAFLGWVCHGPTPSRAVVSESTERLLSRQGFNRMPSVDPLQVETDRCLFYSPFPVFSASSTVAERIAVEVRWKKLILLLGRR